MKHTASRARFREGRDHEKPRTAPDRQPPALAAMAVLGTAIAVSAPGDGIAAPNTQQSAAYGQAGEADALIAEQQAEIARLRAQVETMAKEIERLTPSANAAPAEAPENEPISEPPPSAQTAAPVDGASESDEIKTVSDQNSTPEETRALGEVVVTSRRKEEKLQDVPIPITVLGGKNLERDRTFDVQDLTRRAPGVTATTPNGRRTGISIRGIGKASGNDSMEPAVGVMVDDVFLSHVGMSYQDFTDLDRVEVLRGPQGTLMGKNTTMGVINYVSRAPSFFQQGMVEGEVGGNQQSDILPGAFKARASYSNGIIDDLLAFRASAFVNTQDGDLHNINPEGGTYNERKRYGGRLQFLLTPSEKLRFRLNIDYAESHENSNVKPKMFEPATFLNGSPRTNTFTSRISRGYFGGYQPIIGKEAWDKIDIGQARPLPTINGGVSGRLDWDIGPGTLTSVLAYREFHFDAKNDSEETKFDIARGGTKVDTEQYSEELRYAWSPFDWLDSQTGLFLMHTETDSTSRTLYGEDAGAFYASNSQYNALIGSNIGLLRSSLNNLFVTTNTRPATDSVALFEQVNWHLTDKATLTLGIRETFESKNNSIAKKATFYDGSPLTPTGNATADAIRAARVGETYDRRSGRRVDEWSTSWLVNPSYKFNDNVMLYASAAGGQKSSSVQFNNSNGDTVYVKPEKSLDFGLGLKTLLLDKSLMLNINLYHTTVTDYQATTSIPDATQPTGYRSELGNIPEITAMGVEIDSAYYPTSWLTFTFGGAYNHARYTDWKTATCPAEIPPSVQAVCDNTGKQVVGAPELTGIFGVDLHKPLGLTGLIGHAWANSVVRSSQNLEAQLSSWGKQDAYQVTDVGLGLITGGKIRYELNLVANNLFDTKYTTSINDFSNTYPVGYDGIGARRYVGLVLRSTF
jgi:iron complex outermembrane receptor protein